MKSQNVSEGGRGSAVLELNASQFAGNSEWLRDVKVLSESLPHIQRFSGEALVIKYDGAVMEDANLSARFASDVVLLKQVGINPIIVHGGDRKVGEILARFGKECSFVNGLRVVDVETLEIAEMVLSGLVNKEVVRRINDAGGCAVGVSGKDACLVGARKMCCTSRDGGPNNIEKIMDVGFVGEPSEVNTDLLFLLEESDFIPVISPICGGANGATYMVNPDLMAGAIASAVSAARLLILADVADCVKDAGGHLIREISSDEAEKLLGGEGISASVLHKLQACIKFARETCGTSHIVDCTIPHILLLSLFTAHGAGTTLCCEFGKE
ncbi:acetylglutamate kinase [Anaplasma capra]|uniref:acetylglutamate kinase n=1 Tax=Anaplasma capra TaxID=1562740 RepID=UPI0021D5F9AB|nr:acetylglutamate kinase [Anaplasma capra]MCU7611575.1 acetylglutamate kinase [Anaplasma capra]MCU7611986.1 acetylglutamate kinase [Anaplasma capra]